MFNFFEQPWTLLGISVLVLFGVLTVRSVIPEKRHFWQWLIPVLVAGVAFGADALVETDIEKIDAVLDVGIKAIEEEDFKTIGDYISEDYSDSFHNSKEQLVSFINRELTQNIVEKNKKTRKPLITTSANQAKVNLFMLTTLNQNSNISQIYPNINFLQMKIDINFEKQNDQWLIKRIEIRKINQQSVSWNQVR